MSNRRITLFLIDDDPIFRLGLATALDAMEDLQILVQGDTQQFIERQEKQLPDLIVLDPGVRGWRFSQYLKQKYSPIKICLLSWSLSPQELLSAKKSGIEGYCPKGKSVDELVNILRQIALGENSWQCLTMLINSQYQKYSPRQRWLTHLFQSGINQIEQNLTVVNSQLNQPQLSGLDWVFWTGRRRELLVSRWIVCQLMPQETELFSESSQLPQTANNPPINASISSITTTNFPLISPYNDLTVATVLDRTLSKIQLGVENTTNIPLEIDILHPHKRQELFYLVYNQVRKLITELLLLDITHEELQERLSIIIFRIWEESTRLFIEIYYPNKQKLLDGFLEEIVDHESILIQTNILEKIPLTDELFTYLLSENNVNLEQSEYRVLPPDITSRVDILLENLLIKIANGVMAVILNNFFENDILKKVLYKNGMKSSRDIARFRNQLSWRYRKEKYWQDPKDIFESQYSLFFFKVGKISKISLESPRQQELNQLRGIPWVVTILLETRDAIAPGVRAIVGLIGQELVYILTQVIGRGIGLIGRGIIQGIGNSIEQTKYGKNDRQSK